MEGPSKSDINPGGPGGSGDPGSSKGPNPPKRPEESDNNFQEENTNRRAKRRRSDEYLEQAYEGKGKKPMIYKSDIESDYVNYEAEKPVVAEDVTVEMADLSIRDTEENMEQTLENTQVNRESVTRLVPKNKRFTLLETIAEEPVKEQATKK